LLCVGYLFPATQMQVDCNAQHTPFCVYWLKVAVFDDYAIRFYNGNLTPQIVRFISLGEVQRAQDKTHDLNPIQEQRRAPWF
jgi:hypothetical protein